MIEQHIYPFSFSVFYPKDWVIVCDRVHTNLENLGNLEFSGRKSYLSRLLRRRPFFRKFQGETWCYWGDFFHQRFCFVSLWNIKRLSLNLFYVYLVPLLLYGNLNYSVSVFLYFSIWFLIINTFELIWRFDFCFFQHS